MTFLLGAITGIVIGCIIAAVLVWAILIRTTVQLPW